MITQTRTRYGEVEGITTDGGMALFRGIPYAAPPVGSLRWAPPQEPVAWTGVRRCDSWGTICPQINNNGPDSLYGKEFYFAGEQPTLDEDCLFLNIWTPAEHTDERLPVMFWIYGGGLQIGYGHEIEFDGDALCKNGVILVTINYRVGVLGYFAHPELTDESPHKASGNYGVLDQVQALRWVRENIAAFGGNPDNITVFGQSAGARSTNALCVSPLSTGMLKHAILHSGGGVATSLGRLPRTVLEARGVELMQSAGARSVNDLRDLSWQDLLDAFQAWTDDPMRKGFNLCTDGYALPASLEDSLLQDKQQDIDYLMGHTSLEGVNGNLRPGRPNMAAALRSWARLQLDTGRRPAYMYCFDRQMPGDDAGAFHSSDLWYTFGTLDRCWRPLDERDRLLSDTMIRYWTNFAKNGTPNGKDLPFWKPFLDDRLEMRLGIDVCEMTDFDTGGELAEAEDKLLGSA